MVSVSALAFALGAGVSLAASWLLVSRIERMGGRLGVTDAMLGLIAALAADAPEITSAVSALAGHQQEVGAGVVVGSNVFNLAALLGLGAVAAGWVALHRRVVVLAGAVSLWIALICVFTVLGWLSSGVALILVLAALAPYVFLAASRRRSRLGAWLSTAMGEEELELEAALTASSNRADLPVAVVALVVVVVASVVMERSATDLGHHFSISSIVIGAVVLAAVTSLPNAVAAIYLARRGRGTAMLSTALNSNALNIAFGLLVPAVVVGLGATTGRELFVALWYFGLTALVLALAYRDRGLRRHSGIVILVAYGLFVATLIPVASGHLSAIVVTVPAVVVLAWSVIVMMTPPRGPSAAAPQGSAGSNGKVPTAPTTTSAASGERWSDGRIALVGFVLVATIAVIDALLGHRIVLIGLLVVGPCCGVLTRRAFFTAALSAVAIGCALLVAVPDGVWLTWEQFAFTVSLVIVAVVATTATRVTQRALR